MAMKSMSCWLLSRLAWSRRRKLITEDTEGSTVRTLHDTKPEAEAAGPGIAILFNQCAFINRVESNGDTARHQIRRAVRWIFHLTPKKNTATRLSRRSTTRAKRST